MFAVLAVTFLVSKSQCTKIMMDRVLRGKAMLVAVSFWHFSIRFPTVLYELQVPAANEWFSSSAITVLTDSGSPRCCRESPEWRPFFPYLKPLTTLGISPKPE